MWGRLEKLEDPEIKFATHSRKPVFFVLMISTVFPGKLLSASIHRWSSYKACRIGKRDQIKLYK